MFKSHLLWLAAVISKTKRRLSRRETYTFALAQSGGRIVPIPQDESVTTPDSSHRGEGGMGGKGKKDRSKPSPILPSTSPLPTAPTFCRPSQRDLCIVAGLEEFQGLSGRQTALSLEQTGEQTLPSSGKIPAIHS